MAQIRNAILEDCPGIAIVQVDSYRTAYAGLFPGSYLKQFSYDEQSQDWQELLKTNVEDILLVATEDRQVIGYILARAQPDIYPGYDSEIIALHVKQPFQKQGTGRSLLEEAVRRLIERNCSSVMLWTLEGNPIRRWYEHLQGEIIGKKRFEVDDWEITEVAYGWKEIAGLITKDQTILLK